MEKDFVKDVAQMEASGKTYLPQFDYKQGQHSLRLSKEMVLIYGCLNYLSSVREPSRRCVFVAINC